MSFENLNAKEVLKEIEKKIEYMNGQKKYFKRPTLSIDRVYKELSIFDWWNNYLSISQLEDMKAFLNTAIKLGYDGYVCFKVGAKYCANGMWAHKDVSTDGYSPDGDFIYRSFTPEYVEWDAEVNGELISKIHNMENKLTLQNLKKYLKEGK